VAAATQILGGQEKEKKESVSKGNERDGQVVKGPDISLKNR